MAVGLGVDDEADAADVVGEAGGDLEDVAEEEATDAMALRGLGDGEPTDGGRAAPQLDRGDEGGELEGAAVGEERAGAVVVVAAVAVVAVDQAAGASFDSGLASARPTLRMSGTAARAQIASTSSSFAEETTEPRDGTVRRLTSTNPVWANLVEWVRQARLIARVPGERSHDGANRAPMHVGRDRRA